MRVTEVIAQQTYWNAEDLAEIIVAFAKESRITSAVADILKLHAFRGKEGPESHLQYETECYVMGNAPETTKTPSKPAKNQPKSIITVSSAQANTHETYKSRIRLLMINPTELLQAIRQ